MCVCVVMQRGKRRKLGGGGGGGGGCYCPNRDLNLGSLNPETSVLTTRPPLTDYFFALP